MTSKNTPTDPANAAGTVTANPGPQPEELAAATPKGMVVKQDADSLPLMWNGVGAFQAGAFVPADHPGYAAWKKAGVLEPAVDVFGG